MKGFETSPRTLPLPAGNDAASPIVSEVDSIEAPEGAAIEASETTAEVPQTTTEADYREILFQAILRKYKKSQPKNYLQYYFGTSSDED